MTKQTTSTGSEWETLRGIESALAEVREAEADLAGWVAAARANGVSWTKIGHALGGISKQAAQQRYGSTAPIWG